MANFALIQNFILERGERKNNSDRIEKNESDRMVFVKFIAYKNKSEQMLFETGEKTGMGIVKGLAAVLHGLGAGWLVKRPDKRAIFGAKIRVASMAWFASCQLLQRLRETEHWRLAFLLVPAHCASLHRGYN